MLVDMSKPFAISPREQFTVLQFLLNTPTENRDERAKRKALWEELGVVELKRKVIKIQQPKPQGAPPPDPANDPDGVYAWQYAGEEPTVRVALHQTTIAYLIEKISGRLEGVLGEVLGELCERIIALRDTSDEASITKSAGGGYKLPYQLWTASERGRDSQAHPVAVPADVAAE